MPKHYSGFRYPPEFKKAVDNYVKKLDPSLGIKSAADLARIIIDIIDMRIKRMPDELSQVLAEGKPDTISVENKRMDKIDDIHKRNFVRLLGYGNNKSAIFAVSFRSLLAEQDKMMRDFEHIFIVNIKDIEDYVKNHRRGPVK